MLAQRVVRGNAGEHGKPNPVVVAEGAEALQPVAVAYQAIVIDADERRRNEAGVVQHAGMTLESEPCEEREEKRIAQHHGSDIEAPEGERGGLDAEVDVVV